MAVDVKPYPLLVKRPWTRREGFTLPHGDAMRPSVSPAGSFSSLAPDLLRELAARSGRVVMVPPVHGATRGRASPAPAGIRPS